MSQHVVQYFLSPFAVFLADGYRELLLRYAQFFDDDAAESGEGLAVVCLIENLGKERSVYLVVVVS